MAKQAPVETRPLFHPDEIVVALESYAQYPDIQVRQGTRLRADHEYVRRAPEKWCKDGLSDDERARLQRALRPDVAPQEHVPIITRPVPLKDQDAVLCVKAVTANADGNVHLARATVVPVGARIAKSDPVVTGWADHFVPVVAPGLTPQTAVRAKGDRYETRRDEGGNFYLEDDPVLKSRYGEFKRFLVHFAGQWVSRDNPYVTAHSELYEVITDV